MIKNRILLVGASGIIGSYLNKNLSEDFSIQTIVSSRCTELKYDFAVDLTNKQELEKVILKVEPFSILIFLVGLAHSKGKKKDYLEFYENNYMTLKNLLDLLENNNSIPDKILYASSISVYGEKIDKSIYLENSSLDPKSPYAKTKLMAENLLVNNYKHKSWILRFAPIYSEDFRLNIKRRIFFLKIPFIIAKGSYRLSLCNIKNIKDLAVGILTNKISPNIYNISDSNSYSYLELQDVNKNPNCINIPRVLIKAVFFLGHLFKNQFFIENSIKLVSDNIYPSNKIRLQVALNHILKEEA